MRFFKADLINEAHSLAFKAVAVFDGIVSDLMRSNQLLENARSRSLAEVALHTERAFTAEESIQRNNTVIKKVTAITSQ